MAKRYHARGYEPRPVEVIPFDPAKHAEDCEAFLPLTATGNLFQVRRFLAHQPSDRFVDLSLLFRRRGRLVAGGLLFELNATCPHTLYLHLWNAMIRRAASTGRIV